MKYKDAHELNNPSSSKGGIVIFILIFGGYLSFFAWMIIYAITVHNYPINGLVIFSIVVGVAFPAFFIVYFRKYTLNYKRNREILESGKDGMGKYLDRVCTVGKHGERLLLLFYPTAWLLRKIPGVAKRNYRIVYSFTDEQGKERQGKSVVFFPEKQALAFERIGVFPIKVFGESSMIAVDEQFLNSAQEGYTETETV